MLIDKLKEAIHKAEHPPFGQKGAAEDEYVPPQFKLSELRSLIALLESAQALRLEIGDSNKDMVTAAIDGDVYRRFTQALTAIGEGESASPEK